MNTKPKVKSTSIKEEFLRNVKYGSLAHGAEAAPYEKYTALAQLVNTVLIDRWLETERNYETKKAKRVYYLSLEFLLGRLLESNIINLGIHTEIQAELSEVLSEQGLSLSDLLNEEVDAGIGNGGLGRLAACFIDSLATLGIPSIGYGIRYDYGIFRQEVRNGYQTEHPDNWLEKGNPWEIERKELAVTVNFAGRVRIHQNDNKTVFEWVDTRKIRGVAYDTLVAGYGGKTVNTLRLWAARAIEEFNFDNFNAGDYDASVADRMWAENITRVLYPNDKLYLGKELRLKQQYFFVACSLADIIRQFKGQFTAQLKEKSENQRKKQSKKTGINWKKLPCMAAIQLNDTHPSIAVVELLRILIDEEQLDWDSAWNITVQCMGYTNHTLMPEALEKWSVPMFENLLPRHLQLIYEINRRFLEQVTQKFPPEYAQSMSIIEESEPKMIRMAYLAIIGSHSTNGVAHLHTELLRKRMVPQFADMFPERFNNKTNGITQRRFLLKANPQLAELITSEIGDSWICDLQELSRLHSKASDRNFQEALARVKLTRKNELIAYLQKNYAVSLDSSFIFDVHIKRIHEYKRQILNALHIIMLYNRILGGVNYATPRVFIFAGKAAPGYEMAKLIIKLINNLSAVINSDLRAQGQLQVHFLANYRVSLAEMLIPAADISEQISTAGTEASGTGNMKFMVNGALTIGTLDGANIEMLSEVGKDNIFIFGLNAEEIENLRPTYNPQDFLNNPEIKGAIDLLKNGHFDCGERGIFEPILHSLFESGDYYMHLADLQSYADTHEKMLCMYAEPAAWREKMIRNIASCGAFSSDRTIHEYAQEIWKVKPCFVE